VFAYPDIRIYPLILWQPKIQISQSEKLAVCKNCVNCACGIVAVLQIIAKATNSHASKG